MTVEHSTKQRATHRTKHPGVRHGAALALMALMALLALPVLSSSAYAAAPTDGEALRSELRQHYPSLKWVERYRQAYPADAQGNDMLLGNAPASTLDTVPDLLQALLALQDQHVAIAGAQAGKQETLGVLFRTSSDGAMVVWRLLDPAITTLREGEQITDIDAVPVQRWLARAGALTFGGNQRSRMAEAALKLGFATPLDHGALGLGKQVRLGVRAGDGTVRSVALAYQAMTPQSGAALAQAVERADLPESLVAHGYKVGVLRFGAFAPQYETAFNTAAAAADVAGASADGPMLAGFCAVVRQRLSHIDALAARSDLLLIDLRGNLGGFGREARLLARALTPQALAATYDVFPGAAPGRLKLLKQVDDAACGTLKTPRPLVVWTDAGTRSAGEFMATWLWSAGAIAAGERTIGAGGGRDSEAAGFVLPRSGLRVKYSGNFSVFDHGASLKEGEIDETRLLDQVAADHFAPSRSRPFAIQAVGLLPDVPLPTNAADLSDGGGAAVQRLVGELARRGLLAPPAAD